MFTDNFSLKNDVLSIFNVNEFKNENKYISFALYDDLKSGKVSQIQNIMD